MKKFKKVYIEITNSCNLSCSFCAKTKRKKEFMNKEHFSHILNELKPFTNYLCFHILGEPLLHPQINEFIDMASINYKINITTNGYLIENIKYNKHIRQINISLHSFNGNNLNEYMNNILSVTEELIKAGSIVNYRFWTDNQYSNEIIEKLNEFYGIEIKLDDSFKIKSNVFISKDEEFIWPKLTNKKTKTEKGTCLGLKSHFGILVDGSVIPCCLDAEGIINLGNIFKNDINSILNDKRTVCIKEGFSQNKKIEELCHNCHFYNSK